MAHQPNSWSKHPGTQIEQVLAYCRDEQKYVGTRIEQVLAYCRDEQKYVGTRIEQVLAYCRDEQKYVGCIELLFCLTVTMTFGIQTWKFIGLMDVILPLYQPSFTEIRSKIREK